MAQTNPSPPSPSEAVSGNAPRPASGTGPTALALRSSPVRVILRTADGLVTSDGIDTIPAMPGPAGAIVWVDAAGASADQVGRIATRLGLHELIVEDILEGNQRAKIEVTDDLVHVVMFALRYGDPIVAVRDRHRPGAGLPADRRTAPDWDPLAQPSPPR